MTDARSDAFDPLLLQLAADVFDRAREQLVAAEGEIDAAHRRLAMARDCLREHLLVIAHSDSPERQRHVEGAIVALQSEDIAGQLLQHARHRVHVLSQLAPALAPGRTPPERLLSELDSAAAALEALASRRRPVALAPVTVGDLEFF